MRKSIALFLLFVMIVSCLSACVDTPNVPVDEPDIQNDEPFVPKQLTMPEVNWSASEDLTATADILQEYLIEYYNQLAKYPVRYTGDKSYYIF